MTTVYDTEIKKANMCMWSAYMLNTNFLCETEGQEWNRSRPFSEKVISKFNCKNYEFSIGAHVKLNGVLEESDTKK